MSICKTKHCGNNVVRRGYCYGCIVNRLEEKNKRLKREKRIMRKIILQLKICARCYGDYAGIDCIECIVKRLKEFIDGKKGKHI